MKRRLGRSLRRIRRLPSRKFSPLSLRIWGGDWVWVGFGSVGFCLRELEVEQFEGAGLELGGLGQAGVGVLAVADADLVAAERAEVGEQVGEAVGGVAVGGVGAAGLGLGGGRALGGRDGVCRGEWVSRR